MSWRLDMGLPLTRTDPPPQNPQNTQKGARLARAERLGLGSAYCADSAEGVASASTTPAPLGPEALRRRYADHLAAVAGTLENLAAEKRAAWLETALDWLEADPERELMPNGAARRAATRALAAAGVLDPDLQPAAARVAPPQMPERSA